MLPRFDGALMRVLWLLLLIGPTASAQWDHSLLVTVDAPEDLLEPLHSVTMMTHWTSTCMVDPAAPPILENAAQLSWTQPSAEALQLSGRNAINVTLPDCITAQTATWEFPVTLTAMRDAPGLVRSAATIEGALTWATPTGEMNSEANRSFEATPNAFLQLEAKLDAKIRQGSPGGNTTFDIEVTNFGNTAAVIGLTSTPALAHPDLWPATPLEPGATQTLQVAAGNPDSFGWDNSELAYTLTLTPRAALAPEKEGQPVHVTMVARTRSDVEAPGPALPLVVVGLAATAAGQRRKEGERKAQEA